MKCLITGGCGFVGSNHAAEVLKRGDELFVFDNLSSMGSRPNLEWLKQQGEFKFYHSDIRNPNDVERAIKDAQPDVIFHFAAQVAMTTSLSNPRLDFETNALGTFNLLEAVKNYSPYASILFSSTNKVYGDLEYLTYEEMPTRYISKEYPNGFDETTRLDFHSPYGCSKGAADQYLLDYYRMFGIKTVIFRHSTMYGDNQRATFDQGWIGWFIQKALEIKNGTAQNPFTISGNGKQVRDILHCSDVVNLYFMAAENIEKTKGEIFNIGGGIDNSLSLLELFALCEDLLKIKMNYTQIPVRESDQLIFIADSKKAMEVIGWTPLVSASAGISKSIEWAEKFI